MHSIYRATVKGLGSTLVAFALLAWSGCDDLFSPVFSGHVLPPPETETRTVLASSDFEGGIDGWSMPARANGDEFDWTPNQGSDETAGLLWKYWNAGTALYFAAGPEFLGDKSAALHGLLTFDLFSGYSRRAWTPDASQPLVILEGINGLRIGAGFDPVSKGWRSHAISLDESGKWMNLSEQRLATEAEIADVLSNLTDLRIRGVSTPAVLDNVMLVAP